MLITYLFPNSVQLSQTFLLEMISFNADGTTSIKTSVPCEAGSSTDICMIEVSVAVPT